MQRLLASGSVIFGALLLILVGVTGAFFSDTEVSKGNTFTAGTLDLKIDNDSYYNGNRCTNVGTEEEPVWEWVGESSYPEPGTPCETSFPKSDLDDGFVFFKFDDLKPDDEGEDTISIHVQNDAWACMDLTLTSNDDRSTTEPEGLVDEPEDEGDAWDGELAENLQFFWWADDGDNVYEVGEESLTTSGGIETLLGLAPQGESFSITLADSQNNAWGLEAGTPLPGGDTVYIAKAWCMGDLTMNALPDDADTGPTDRPDFFSCEGTDLGNETQTDGVELNVAFTAMQARHNDDFLCDTPGEEETVTLTVNKIIVADTVGIGVEDFELHIDGPSGDIIVGDNVPEPGLVAGTYTVSEVIIEAGLPPGVEFTATFGGACDPNTHEVTLAPGENLVCTITNVEIEPTSLVDENFGTGTCLGDIAGWDEDPGESCPNGTVAAAIGSGDDTVSPDGGRFGLLSGNNGYICRSVNAAGLESLVLKYYWRGDSQGDVGETGSVKYATGGTCAAPTGVTTLTSHPLTTTVWSSLETIALPGSLDNSSFLILFTADSNGGNESLRVDGIELTGLPI